MSRDELIKMLLERQTLVRGFLKANALTRDQLEDGSEWTTTDLRTELIALDKELQDAKYKGLDSTEMVQVCPLFVCVF
jgi:hypothetical protein